MEGKVLKSFILFSTFSFFIHKSSLLFFFFKYKECKMSLTVIHKEFFFSSYSSKKPFYVLSFLGLVKCNLFKENIYNAQNLNFYFLFLFYPIRYTYVYLNMYGYKSIMLLNSCWIWTGCRYTSRLFSPFSFLYLSLFLVIDILWAQTY